ncbi:sugar transaminase [Thermosipho africanus H17ap60334]|uniref:Sugar transaminase, involved in dTDP-4-amino-4,6-dideoxyglucose biosynthesis n=1 Tax=Thermosipho africanus (strain TCF52B) TaxID=484019 RepID=B7IGW5_THEAB|nr:DegT/DnrJ/EryC1/StrS family aminotransferase [Thermosipho africanus]ACJ75329.1 sugar transaminase, involved in dTDP-4-amino-4,6-dideoxyglucose biosynthesis [Thermosipho africanus TCF52B]EKF48514.1 sugar transaminase [Thermosipho africanus H17ap60334]RDI90833.1 sugar transaminase [Thermosipho africanus Ob7]
MINVTRSIMPDFEKYTQMIEKLWETRWLTNNGEYLVKLEKALEERFNTKCAVVSNGTLALLIAIELFDFPKDSEIITTPFTFVATSSSIIWQKYKPVFVDINPETFNIDPNEIEKKITENTRAILAVHVFGNPCDIEKIEEIAKKHRLKIIYDAAHCFDVYYKGESIYKFGDVSIASFHATKVFHTIEGGAIFSDNDELIRKAKRLRNFGFNEEIEIEDKGINAKMNEFQAAMGLLNLEIVGKEIKKRKKIYESYKEKLKGLVKFQKLSSNITKYNYIYMPVLFENQEQREKAYKKLKEEGYNTRKYFFPSLDTVFNQENQCKTSQEISKRILHLPLYGDLEEKHVEKICTTIEKVVRG